jgi:hypothetical protein
MYSRILTCMAGIALVAGGLAGVSTAVATRSHRVHVRAQLTVTGGPPPACGAGICTIRNHGTGRLTPFGKVTFTTTITATSAGNKAPCGTGSQWVTRVIRTIHTSRGTLVLDEAGLQCPQPGVGPRVDLVWAADGADSIGIFAGANGRGSDVAFPTQNTAASHGTITLAR